MVILRVQLAMLPGHPGTHLRVETASAGACIASQEELRGREADTGRIGRDRDPNFFRSAREGRQRFTDTNALR
jgi:hypothetical protein